MAEIESNSTLPWLLARRGRWLALVAALSLLAHLPFAGRPPGGTHVWRQCNTLAVARNFAEEEFNLLRPRVDRRYDTDGVTGMQFPSYEAIVAALYRTVGFSEAIPRVVNLLALLAAVAALYDVAWQLSRSRIVAALAAWGLAWSPELFYMGFVALPDVLALAASIGGLAAFLRWQQHRRVGAWLLALGGFTLAGLTKLQFLAVGLPVAVVVGTNALAGNYSRRQLGALVVLGAVSAAVPVAWYAYARQLIEASGLADFGLAVRPAPSWGEGSETLWRNVRTNLPEDLLGYVATVLLVVAVVTVWKSGGRRHWFFWPAVMWGAGLAAYHIAELNQMRHHTYYMFPYLPLLMLGVGAGGAWLRPRLPGWAWGGILALMPLLTVARIVPARWLRTEPEVRGVPTAPAERSALARLAPPGALAVVGPDDSGCIMLYLLHRKGFGFDYTGRLAEPAPPPLPGGVAPLPAELQLPNFIRRGARVLYTTDSTVWHDPRLRPYLGPVLGRWGQLRVIELRPDSGPAPAGTLPSPSGGGSE